MSDDTSLRPPPDDEDLSEASDRQLLERLIREFGRLSKRVRKIERRLGQGDTQFTTVDANIGILINSVQALCEGRGLEEHVGRLGAALDRWSERRRAARGNGAEHAEDVPTNPENEIPAPPRVPKIDDDQDG